MSYFNISFEELQNLQKKIENIEENYNSMSEVINISEEIDEIIKIKR